MRNTRRQAGLTSVLAMLFLVLFTTMALGFYAATNTAMHVTNNDERVARAFVGSESGMDFMRYQLARVNIPANTPQAQVIDHLYSDLQSHLNGTGNLASATISRSGSTISIPSSGWIKLDSGGNSSFRATITDWAGEIVVKTEGHYGETETAGRAITMDFTRQPHITTTFNFAVASKGQIVASKGMITSVAGVDPAIASMMSAKAGAGAVNVSGSTIGGDLSIVDGGTAQVTSGSVGGSSVPAVILSQHVHVVDPPEFPTVDTSVYRAYATNTYNSHAGVQSNIYVPPNTNPTFNGNNTVQGIMYIASPNQVTINGSFNLQGFIVMATTKADGTTSSTDTLNLSGNLTMSALPNQPQFNPLRSVSGVAVLAPNAAMTMTGSSSSIRGNILVNTFRQAGASAVQIDQGTLMTYSPNSNSAVFDSSKWLKFSSTGANNQPNTGVSYSTYYTPRPGTYQEVAP